MPQWFNVRKSDGVVLGWQSSSGNIPSDTADVLRVLADEDLHREYVIAAREARRDGRENIVLWNGTNFVLPSDNRPFVRIEIDKNQVIANGVDEVTLTITALQPDGTVRGNLNGTFVREILPGRLFFLTFNNGVSVKAIRFRDSGRFRLASNEDVKIETPIVITAAE